MLPVSLEALVYMMKTKQEPPSQSRIGETGTKSRLVELETEDSRDVALCCLLRLEVPISHQKQMRKCGSKICPIDIWGKVKVKDNYKAVKVVHTY